MNNALGLSESPNILIALPIYNEAQHLSKVLCEIVETYPDQNVLVINDGSSDDSEKIIQNYPVQMLRHGRNLGKGAAILTAVRFAQKKGYEWLIVLDGDGQHAVDQIRLFIQEIAADRYDLILGNRIARMGKMPVHRILSNGITSIMVSLCAGQGRIHDSQCGFRALRLSCVKPELYRYKGFQMESEIILRFGKSGLQMREIAVDTIYLDEKSEMKLLSDTIKFIILIANSMTW